MDSELIDEFTRVNIMDKIRRIIYNYYEKWNKWRKLKSYDMKFVEFKKKKEISILISNILFFREHDKFFPIVGGSSDSWMDVARNKMKYIADPIYESHPFLEEIKFIKSTFIESVDEWENIRASIVRKIRDEFHNDIVIYMRDKVKKVLLWSNIFPKTRFFIRKEIYEKLIRTINSIPERNIDNIPHKDRIVFLTMMRYEKLLNSKNHQLGIKYAKFNIEKFDVELFASPINRTLKEFCSAYPDVDKYYVGNVGSFFDYTLKSGKKYTLNPPYVEHLMTRAVTRLVNQLNRKGIVNIEVFVTIPIWDYSTVKMLAAETKNEKIGKVYKKILVTNRKWTPYVPYEILKDSPYIESINVFGMEDYEYYDHLAGKNISVSNTFHIILKKK